MQIIVDLFGTKRNKGAASERETCQWKQEMGDKHFNGPQSRKCREEVRERVVAAGEIRASAKIKKKKGGGLWCNSNGLATCCWWYWVRCDPPWQFWRDSWTNHLTTYDLLLLCFVHFAGLFGIQLKLPKCRKWSKCTCLLSPSIA